MQDFFYQQYVKTGNLFSKLIFASCRLFAGPCSCMQPETNSSRSILPFLSASRSMHKVLDAQKILETTSKPKEPNKTLQGHEECLGQFGVVFCKVIFGVSANHQASFTKSEQIHKFQAWCHLSKCPLLPWSWPIHPWRLPLSYPAKKSRHLNFCGKKKKMYNPTNHQNRFYFDPKKLKMTPQPQSLQTSCSSYRFHRKSDEGPPPDSDVWHLNGRFVKPTNCH